MKKILLIFLSLLILFNSSGYIILITHFKLQFRSEIQKNDYFKEHKNELSCFQIRKNQLNIDNAEFYWEDENEFEYQGKMYDVVLRQETENDFVLYCVNDVKEENFSAFVKQTGSKADPADALPLGKILVKKPVIIGIPADFSQDLPSGNAEVFFCSLPDRYVQVQHLPDTPPPRFS